MKGLLEYLVDSLVDQPDRVTIRESIGQKNVAYIVYVDPEDLGKVIGKGGRIANALRILLRAAGGLHDKVIWVDFNRQPSR
ncbi:MAG: KH domain-containing protein [Armatimonadota bacterium]